MDTAIHLPEKIEGIKKRKSRRSKDRKERKRVKIFSGTGGKVKIDKKMKKLFRKRAREYNSDDDDDEANPEVGEANTRPLEEFSVGNSSEEEGIDGSDPDAVEEKGDSEDEGDRTQPGITKFTEGCRAFRVAFMKITKTNVSDNSLGPVLSAQKRLIAKKLAEEEAEWKSKGDAKKEKHLVGEKGHVKPANFLDSREKFLISVATKGVVKLFNAVNKAQNAQKGLNPSRFKDAKALGKRQKEAFFSELRKPSQAVDPPAKGDDGPAWAPLRDSYMLTSSKLKDWDKMPETTVGNDMDGIPLDSSSDSSSDDD
ncbi:PREDICTED: RRP15-like protein [Nelumbo nucifera]|uniref:RRP15-like protein n=1 Tax=Nelumbo nucifera TaxID=4432 RepID=A0A1U8B4E6_NELNU|nr:PREDICTED: RRP15-like protein [Nelumbo nucifera]